MIWSFPLGELRLLLWLRAQGKWLARLEALLPEQVAVAAGLREFQPGAGVLLPEREQAEPLVE